MKYKTLKYILTFCTILNMIDFSNTQKLPKEASFRQDSQSKSFFIDIIDLLPMTQSEDEYWSISKVSIDHIDLPTGQIFKRFSLSTHLHCVRETNDKNYKVYSLNIIHKKLYGFNLKNGKLEDDLKIPELSNESDWKTILNITCLEHGLEIKFEDKKFIFFKDYQDVNVSIKNESVHDLSKEIFDKEMYRLFRKESKQTRKIIFI